MGALASPSVNVTFEFEDRATPQLRRLSEVVRLAVIDALSEPCRRVFEHLEAEWLPTATIADLVLPSADWPERARKIHRRTVMLHLRFLESARLAESRRVAVDNDPDAPKGAGRREWRRID